MKLFISTALLACSFACSFSLFACDQTLDQAGATTLGAPNAAIEALTALGPERRIVPASAEETERFVERSYDSKELFDALVRLSKAGYWFKEEVTVFWTEGHGERLATVVQRGRRAGSQVLVTTVMRADLSILSSFEVQGDGESFEVQEVAGSPEDGAEVASPGFTFVAEDAANDDSANGELGMKEGALIGYTGSGTSTQCLLQNGIIDAGGQVADGLCLGEANFVCFWQYIGNDRAFNRCVNQRVAACQIGTDKWSAPVCN